MKEVYFILFFIIGSLMLSSCGTLAGLAVGSTVHQGVKPVTVVLNERDSINIRNGDRVKVHLKLDPSHEMNVSTIKGNFTGIEKTDLHTFLCLRRKGAIQKIDVEHIAKIQPIISKGARIGLIAGVVADLTTAVIIAASTDMALNLGWSPGG